MLSPSPSRVSVLYFRFLLHSSLRILRIIVKLLVHRVSCLWLLKISRRVIRLSLFEGAFVCA